MKRFLILAAMLCGLTTIGASSSEAQWGYRGYYGGYGYRTPYYGGYGYRAPYRSYYRGGWNRGFNRGWGGPGFYAGGRRGGVFIGW